MILNEIIFCCLVMTIKVDFMQLIFLRLAIFIILLGATQHEGWCTGDLLNGCISCNCNSVIDPVTVVVL